MKAGEERKALVDFADRLCAELGYPEPGDATDQAPETVNRLFGDLLSPEQETLVETAHRSLGRIARALAASHPKVVSETTYRALLDGAELVMRSELAAGNRISTLMPSFVFLVSLPMLSQDQALELSRRTASLLEAPAG